MKTVHSSLGIHEDSLLEEWMWENYSDHMLQPGWFDYDDLYVFGKSLHQQEYKVLRKDLDAGLSKQQISNLFSSHGTLRTANLSPLTAIEKFSGVRNGKIRDPTQKNLLLFDGCFLGKQNKAEAYYTRGRHNNCDTVYIAQNSFMLPRDFFSLWIFFSF